MGQYVQNTLYMFYVCIIHNVYIGHIVVFVSRVYFKTVIHSKLNSHLTDMVDDERDSREENVSLVESHVASYHAAHSPVLISSSS